MIRTNTISLASHTAAIESCSGLKLVALPSSLFSDEQVRKGMLAESGPWKSFAEAVQALLATPYDAVLLFAGGASSPVEGLFPRTSRASRLAELMVQTNLLPPCRKTAYPFPGLLSIVNPMHTCACPLKLACGTCRIDTIRLESKGTLLGDLMMFVETGTTIDHITADKIKITIQTIADSLLQIMTQGENEGIDCEK